MYESAAAAKRARVRLIYVNRRLKCFHARCFLPTTVDATRLLTLRVSRYYYVIPFGTSMCARGDRQLKSACVVALIRCADN